MIKDKEDSLQRLQTATDSDHAICAILDSLIERKKDGRHRVHGSKVCFNASICLVINGRLGIRQSGIKELTIAHPLNRISWTIVFRDRLMQLSLNSKCSLAEYRVMTN